MRLKGVVTAVLLIFVGASVVYLILRESAGNGRKTQQTARGSSSSPRSPERPGGPGEQKPKRRIVAYYFHGNMRCMTCRTIEAYAREALGAAFGDDLKNGRLEWHVVNVHEPGNEHCVDDYQLAASSLVLAEFVGGDQKRWKNLQRIWQLVRDKDTFFKYVQDETRAYLEAKN